MDAHYDSPYPRYVLFYGSYDFLAYDFSTDVYYTVTLSGIEDLAGNVMPDSFFDVYVERERRAV